MNSQRYSPEFKDVAVRMLIMFLAIPFWVSHSHATEPASSDELLDPVKLNPPPFHAIEGKIYLVDAETRGNCEGWVRLAYGSSSDISNGNVKILDSKPSGKYDDEAIQALADSLSKQTHDPDAGLSKVVDENRHEMKVFTYSVGCNNVSVLYEKPEKAPDPDAK